MYLHYLLALWCISLVVADEIQSPTAIIRKNIALIRWAADPGVSTVARG